ncbi:MAG: NYN domain-containing protein [Candidatus Peribacteraceae bacterium]|nr:NYN domain-containing protein [Candidatus Peribacteraceae bacterium]
MQNKANNYAFIDGQNLYLGIRDMGWNLDYKKFRVYLAEKYGVTKAFIVMGYIPTNVAMYTHLQSCGFILIFKPTYKGKDGKVKGNCDADLVLNAMIEFPNYDKAVIITGDGDFHCLIKYLREKNKLATLLVPNQTTYSGLLKTAAATQIAFMNDLKQKMSKKSTP